MGEITDRLDAAKALAAESREEILEKKKDRTLSRVDLVWGIIICLLTGAFTMGRNLVTRQEADQAYVRRDVYARDYENTTKQLDSIERKLDKLTEVVSAHP